MITLIILTLLFVILFIISIKSDIVYITTFLLIVVIFAGWGIYGISGDHKIKYDILEKDKTSVLLDTINYIVHITSEHHYSTFKDARNYNLAQKYKEGSVNLYFIGYDNYNLYGMRNQSGVMMKEDISDMKFGEKIKK